mgnify:CR=1 FL=1
MFLRLLIGFIAPSAAHQWHTTEPYHSFAQFTDNLDILTHVYDLFEIDHDTNGSLLNIPPYPS